jgi:peptide/nickel transport system substrate-binding protein
MKLRLSGILVVLVLVLLTGCTKAAPAPPSSASSLSGPQVQGAFIEGTFGGDAETLNWILAADASSLSYVAKALDPLGGYDNNFNPVLYHLAKPVETSPDGLTYTVTIRGDLKWSDGQKVTSDDYVYTLKNMMFSDWLNYPYKDQWQETVDGKSVFVDLQVINDTIFTIARQTVDPEFIDNNIYSLIPYPKHIVTKYEGDIKGFTQAPELNNLSYTGNLGAYKYSDWIRNDKFVMDRNPDYYLGKTDHSPYFQQWETKIFGTSAATLAALEAGDISNAGIAPEQVAKFKQLPKIAVYTIPSSGYDLILLNQRKNGWEGLQHKSVRQALAMSLSKKQVIDSIRMGFGDPAFSFIPKPSPWYTEEGLSKFGWEGLYDKAKAKQLLLDAGYAVKKADGTIAAQGKDGKPIKLTLATTPGGAIAENLAYLVKQEMAGIGIEIDIKLVPWESLLRQYVMNKVPGTDMEPRYNNGPSAVSDQPWDMIVMALNTNPVAPSGSRVFFTSDGGLNYWGYSDTKVDDLFKRVTSKEALDKNARKQLYSEISRTIADDQPAIFLTFPRGNDGFLATVKGIDPGINLGWNYYKWYFAQP